MHIYIDETGDTGFKTDRGSSQIFCIALLVFKKPEEIEKTVQAIKKLQERINFHQKEWKFSKTTRERRIEFLKTIVNYSFEIRAVVMNKKNIDGPRLTTNKDTLYNYTCKLVLQYMERDLDKAKVIFDKRGNREFHTELKKYIRTKCNIGNHKIKEIISKDSHKEIPLQIVDMIAGAIGRRYGIKQDKEDYIKIIRPRIKNLFTFPDDLK